MVRHCTTCGLILSPVTGQCPNCPQYGSGMLTVDDGRVANIKAPTWGSDNECVRGSDDVRVTDDAS